MRSELLCFIIPSNHNRLYHFLLFHVVGLVAGVIVDWPVVPIESSSTEVVHLLLNCPNGEEEEEAVVEVRHTSCWSDHESEDIDRILRVEVDAEIVVASIVAANVVVDTFLAGTRKIVHGHNPSWPAYYLAVAVGNYC